MKGDGYIIERIYNENHCWQYGIRKNLLERDIRDVSAKLDMSEGEISALRVSDFDFAISDKSDFDEIKSFITKYEWLGTLPSYPTHYFTARYNGILAGVLIYSMPNAFSKLLGDNTRLLERLLSRGACASWTPKNLASSFIMWSIDYMVKNTQYRLFTAYSDPMAKELGTIYQACNWIYIGQTSGSTYRYKEPDSDRWVSDRKFRNVSSYKRYARELDIEWQDDWSVRRSMKWNNMPDDVEEILKQEGRDRQTACKRVRVPPKHKYIYIRGRDKRETRVLMGVFKKQNPRLVDLEYPRSRGK